jgi:hypothetical protein
MSLKLLRENESTGREKDLLDLKMLKQKKILDSENIEEYNPDTDI